MAFLAGRGAVFQKLFPVNVCVARRARLRGVRELRFSGSVGLVAHKARDSRVTAL